MASRPFDDIHALIDALPEAPEGPLTADPSLGRLGLWGAFVARWRADPKPRVRRPIIALYAGSHAPGGGDQARERLEAAAAGRAPVNALAQASGAGLEAFDLALDRPVGDIVKGPAMSERECAATMAFGMEVLAKQPDLLIVGSISAGGALSTAALALALFGGAAEDWAGDDAERVTAAVARLHAEAGPDPEPLEMLRHLGGRETAALAGAILGARTQNVPVLIDGMSGALAVAVLGLTGARSVEHVLAGHVSTETGHGAALERLGLWPVLDLELGLSEGAGAAAALAIVRLACETAAP